MGLHPLSEALSATFSDSDSMKRLLEVFEPGPLLAEETRFLGSGQYGVAILLISTSSKKTYAVKITDSEHHMGEAVIAGQLCVHHPAFIQTYGWLQFHGIPDLIARQLPERDHTGEVLHWNRLMDKRLLYIFMEHSSFRLAPAPGHTLPGSNGSTIFWEYFNHNPRQILHKILFVLLHGLAAARREVQFAHHDIHDGQIMLFRRRDSDEPLTLGKYRIKDCFVLPKFIDFGMSATNAVIQHSGNPNARIRLIGEEVSGKEEAFRDASPQERDGTDDVFQLVQLFVNRNSDFSALMETDEFEAAAASSRSNWKVIEALLDAPFFREILASE